MKEIDPQTILEVLDRCSDAFTFPMLDNGYLYLAASRLSLFRSSTDWAMVIELFGFSPRAALPDIHIHTFASRLHDRDARDKYESARAYENYLENNPNNDSRFVFPMGEGAWQDAETLELVAEDAGEVAVRGTPRPIPAPEECERYGIELVEPPRVQTFELCRVLAEVVRDDVLATPAERRISVLPEMQQVLQLEEWYHPDVVAGERPSGSATFQQLAHVLVDGDVNRYRPTRDPNTHWKHWPDGGTL